MVIIQYSKMQTKMVNYPYEKLAKSNYKSDLVNFALLNTFQPN
jgi:hypothetical protein